MVFLQDLDYSTTLYKWLLGFFLVAVIYWMLLSREMFNHRVVPFLFFSFFPFFFFLFLSFPFALPKLRWGMLTSLKSWNTYLGTSYTHVTTTKTGRPLRYMEI